MDSGEKDRHLFALGRLPLVGSFDRRVHLDSLTCKGKGRPISASAQIFMYLVGVYLSLVLVGSSVTVVEYLAERRVRRESPQRSALVQLANLEVDDDEEMLGEKIGKPMSGLSFANGVRFLKCFSAFSNAAKVLEVSSKSAFPCIHGIRFLSMAWVILGHTYVHNLDIVANLMDLLHSVDNLPFQFVIQGTFSVDTFFVLSGFLLCYLYLEESDKRNGNINWMALIFHRLLRISPVYALLVAFNALVFPHLGSGPFWGDHSDAGACQRVWWWNMLYVNNFLDMDSMCLTWTWYLADDFQFFLFGLLLLHILCVWKRPLLCWTVAGSAFIASIVATGCISYANDLTPMFVGIGSASDYDIYRNRLVRTWDLIYTKPYCRFGPYLVGMLLAHRIHGRTYRQPLTMVSKLVGWCGACACCVGVVYGAWFLGEGGAMPHIYNALSRPMFGGGVAWIVYCCATHNADLVSRFLSWGAWVPLSRLSFCAYLLHPLLMSWYFDSQEEPLHFTHANWVMLYIAFLVVSYAVAFVVSITLEAPIINIEKMMKRGR